MNTTISLMPVLILISLAFLSSCTSTTSDTVVRVPTVQTTIQASPTTETMDSSSTTQIVSSSKSQTERTTVMVSEVATSKSVTYSTDHGKHRVTASFTLTTDNLGLITAAKATMTSGDRESQQYINRFNSAAKSQIVGKKISSLSLSAVGGASDTTDAFMQVVSSL